MGHSTTVKAAVVAVFVLVGTAQPALAGATPAAELRALERSFQGRIGAYAIDTATGKTIAYRSGERFALLSTFKAVAAAAVLARTSDRELTGKVVRWTAEELKPYSPETSKHVEDGMTLAELCRAAIIYSDNTAGNMLLKEIGGPRGLTRYFRTLKDPVSRLDRWETELNEWSPKDKRDTTTPAAIARDLRALTTGNALNAKDRARLVGWLRDNTTGDRRIRAGLPKTWIVGDKTGTGPTYGTANDIAVVWPSEGAAPIIMAIYTNRLKADGSNDDSIVARTATVLARGLGRLP
ncbi:beta-lactamase [Microbispora rosea subsp. aerata]|nr:class A beta-lactamase [Microbispora rosea]GGO17497.1 beta-lactamase [Microbispora rosea subsp. aerata]GIH56556.1 beta-lactamase [Microbispora rosea subsp. aerata]GLJ81915.1 beta-lactamase [Microbispora rosea subsp. aerata]